MNLPIRIQRDERNGADAFAEHRGLEVRGQIRLLHVGDVDGGGVGLARAPRRMTGDRGAVVSAEAARGDELHDAGRVEQQDGGAIAHERRLDRIHRRLIGVLQRIRQMQLLAQLIQGIALPAGRGHLAERHRCVAGA
jgi:hypothetical protein